MPRELTENVLKKTIPQREEFNRYWNGSDKRPVCLKTRMPTTIALYRDTLAGFEDYLMSYAGFPDFSNCKSHDGYNTCCLCDRVRY